MAGIGGWLTGVFGSENKARATGRNVNSDNYQYGGDPMMSEEMADAYTAAGNSAMGRRGVQVDYGQANQDRALGMQSRGLGMQARQGQNQVAQASLARALGQTPSIAQMQAGRDMQAAQAAQAAQAGSARGAGALAAAQRNAANNVANAHASISGQSQINAANERLAAEQSAATQFGNMRGGDMNARGQDLASQGQAAQQAQSQAGFNDAQRARNDQAQAGYNQLAHQTRLAQLAANQNYESQQSSNALGAQGINAGVGGQNASMNQSNAMNLLGMGQAAAGAAFSHFGGQPGQPPQREKGGPVEGRAPYLVGERGPELVVPAKDGYVIPAGPTRDAIQRTPSLARFLGVSARAEGGPVEGGGDREAIIAGRMAPPSSDAGYLPEGYRPPVSTWGGSPVDEEAFRRDAAEAQRTRMAPYEEASAKAAEHRKGLDATAARINETVAGIDERDRDAVWSADYKDRHNQQMTAAEADQATEARYRQGTDAARAKAKKKSLADTLREGGKAAMMAGAGVDTAYHGPGGGYAPPMLIPLQARAMGGPMMGGGAPTMLQPLSGPGSGAAAPSFDVLTSSGGMDPMASLKAHSNFATQFQRNPGASPMSYSAREEGGPMKAGGEPPPIVRVAGASNGPASGDFAGVRLADIIAPVAKDSYEQAASESDRTAEDLEILAERADPTGANAGVRGLLAGAGLLNRGRAVGERYVVPALDRTSERLGLSRLFAREDGGPVKGGGAPMTSHEGRDWMLAERGLDPSGIGSVTKASPLASGAPSPGKEWLMGQRGESDLPSQRERKTALPKPEPTFAGARTEGAGAADMDPRELAAAKTNARTALLSAALGNMSGAAPAGAAGVTHLLSALFGGGR